ncbi:replication restart helicase PriA [Pinibacter soli]|uniref:Replication restart protein PriA n=1 Tax=Pinibacter soli TaxID=3044211 RepID=A0ABT6RDB0_9BACT|nr:primosomal protein N' [Pinibacter soli]MDI3320503.1 primosomal protein N' [Pinibacter soli]
MSGATYKEDLFTEKATHFAEVLLPLALPKNYTWAVPANLLEKVQPGCRVEVVLKNKKYAGIVKLVHTEKPKAFNPQPILNVLDDEPIVFGNQLKLWAWLSDYYMCSEGEVMQAALPTHFKLSSETVLMYNDEAGDDFAHLDDEEFLVAEALLLKKELRLVEVQQILDVSHVYPVIKRLIEKGICFVWEDLKNKYTEKKENFVILHPEFATEEALSNLLSNDKKLQKAEKQMELLLAFLHFMKTTGEVKQMDLLKKSNATAAQLKGLADKGILIIEKRSVDRIKNLPKSININFTLSEAQQKALEEVKASQQQKQVALLHGVTSSGKTQIYVKLIEELLAKNKQVLYMLPEIALTAQVIRRLQIYFGGYIAIYHSKFNSNERIEIWNKVKSGEAKIILGARSALFLPFRDLGLVICDEEHDSSYKQQDPAPRYHARDATIYFASLFGANVILGSATPSLESYYNASVGKYALVELLSRFGDVDLPKIEIVDTKKLFTKEKGKVILSVPLQEAITESLQKQKQVILFQNRRGYSPYQVCQTCGWIPHCHNCDVSLTFHKLSNKLVCHYCGTNYPPVHTCEACGNHHFAQQNFGTERVEEELQEFFPDAKVSRMDMDAVKGKHGHDALIQLFEQQRIDILVGTQMVVKGLDFEHVYLVGILDGDAILGFADFRVSERGFQLMEQVSGRAGRKNEQGKVLVQVRNVNQPVLFFVQQHDFKSFYKSEIDSRKQFQYPPFTRLLQITFKHKKPDVVAHAARTFAQGMQSLYGQYIIGPAQPIINKIRNLYLMEMMLKLPKDTQLINACKHMIQQQTAILHNDSRFKSVVITPDVDPY